MERKVALFDTVDENGIIAVSRHIETNGITFFNLAKQKELEGIVAKRKDSRYHFGKRTKDWVKMKALLDDDFIVCGYYFKSDNVASIIIGSFMDGKIVYQGHVVLGVTREDFRHITSTERTTKNHYLDFPDFDCAVWLVPWLVCRVEFMEKTPGGGLRQPVFKGLREDKLADECIIGTTSVQSIW